MAVIELATAMSVVGKRIATGDIADVLPFNRHVSYTDGIGLVVQPLAQT
jgi:hypothetical protein